MKISNADVKIILFANTDWYLYNFRLPLAKTLKNLGYNVVLISPPGKYGTLILAEGIQWLQISMNRRSLAPWEEIKFIKELISLYKRESPDLVHHFTVKPVIYGTLAARINGIHSRINAVTGLGYVFTDKSLLSSILKPIVKILYRFVLDGKFSRLILQNNDDREYFINNRLVKSDKIRVIRGSGVNTKKFSQINEYNKLNSKIRILLATRLLWDKGLGEYVAAAKILKKECSNCQFIIAGSPDNGNPTSVPYDRIQKWSEEGVIEFLGHIDNMPALLHTVDLVVLPSYREGTPRILLEAAACGLPIVATDVPGCREVVKHEVNGLLVPVKDIISLSEAIKYMVNNPTERERMGKSGREKILSEFDEKIVIEETIDVYKEIHIKKRQRT